ncbi:MAG: hypothetical protein N3B14_04270 [Thermoleophilia bacterium]|nr:hypothetical protein [Thermoleophilia bacterium]
MRSNADKNRGQSTHVTGGRDERASLRRAAPLRVPAPAAILTSVLALMLLLVILLATQACERGDEQTTTTVATATVETFVDMGAGHPDLGVARAAVVYDLLDPDAEGRFKPEDPVARSQFASLLALALGLERSFPPTPTFSDVPPAHPDYAAVEATARYFVQDALAETTSREFRPRDSISHAEAYRVLQLAVQENAPNLASALPAESAYNNSEPLSRADAARLLVPLIRANQPAPAETFEAIGIN